MADQLVLVRLSYGSFYLVGCSCWRFVHWPFIQSSARVYFINLGERGGQRIIAFRWRRRITWFMLLWNIDGCGKVIWTRGKCSTGYCLSIGKPVEFIFADDSINRLNWIFLDDGFYSTLSCNCNNYKLVFSSYLLNAESYLQIIIRWNCQKDFNSGRMQK